MASVSMSMIGSGSGSGGGGCSQFPEREKEKGSRNKRKFRADPPPPLPLVPCIDCNANSDTNDSDKGFVVMNGWKMGCPSMNDSFRNSNDGVDVNISTSATHNHDHASSCYGFCNCCKAQHEHQPNSCNCSGPEEIHREPGYGYEEFSPSREQLQEEEDLEGLPEADWNEITESQLEDLLLTNLDTIYKSAIKKIAACGYTEDVTLKAVLKYGRCYGSKDILSNIIDNAMAYFSNSHDASSKDHSFEDLQQLEKYALAEMVCILREVRPFFSNGDAMWCLLICDMNVAHACAMDEDTLSNLNKDSMPANSQAASPVESNPETSSSFMPQAVSTSMPVFQSDVSPPHPVVQNPQASNSSIPFVTEMPTFPVEGFSMSDNMVQNACKHHNTSGSNILEYMQSETVHPQCRTVDSKFRCSMQIGGVLSSDHFQGSSAFTAAIESESEPGSHVSDMTAEDCVLSMAQPFPKDKNVRYEAAQTDDMKSNLANVKRDSGTLFLPTVVTDKPDRVERSEASLLKMSLIEKGSLWVGIENSNMRCRTKSGSCVTFSGGTEVEQNSVDISDSMQTSLLIGKPNQSVEPELSMRGCRIDPETVDDASSFAVTGTELSLSLASVGDVGAEVVNDSTSVYEDAADSNYDTVSLDQIFGGNGSQDRKDEMLMKMFHRVRELETLLQVWTEWAQQKVMQAAHRLSKDKAELKALRQEKEEAVRLKKEKQSLEESTMKKLSEMENALRKASGQVERANAAVRKLEDENAQVRRDMEAAKLSASESATACQEAINREKGMQKKLEAWERQKARLQEELVSEKRKLVHLQQQLVKAKERKLQIEVKWRQEEKAKEEAIMRAEAEKREKEQVDATAKRREAALRRKEEIDSQQYRDDVQRLEREIAQLRLTSESSKLAAMQWGSDCRFASCLPDTNSIEVLKQTNARLLSEIAELQDLSRREVRRDRECVMCLSEEMSVVFLPCAHQVVCSKCNELHENEGMKDCPSCRTPIQQRVCVNSVNS